MGNELKVGKIPNFDYTEKQLDALIAEYKDKARSGEIELPSWPDFCDFIGCDNATLEAVLDKGFTLRGAYYARAVALKKMGAWCEAQLVSNPNWGGKMLTKSIFLLKQGFGGSKKYLDEKAGGKQAPSAISIQFGGVDPRGKKAGK